jgi:hypothetical protein
MIQKPSGEQFLTVQHLDSKIEVKSGQYVVGLTTKTIWTTLATGSPRRFFEPVRQTLLPVNNKIG